MKSSKFEIWKIKRYIKKFHTLSDDELKSAYECGKLGWAWPGEFGRKPLLFDYLCHYPKQATLKKRLSYLLVAFSPVFQSTFLDDRYLALKIEMDKRGIKR